MKTGIITGVVWASRKVEELVSCPIYLVQPTSSEGIPNGSILAVADPQRLGSSGDMIVYVTSTDAVQAFDNGYAPVNASIVELVEKID